MTVLPPSPLQLGQALTSTFTLYKTRFGLFVGLACLPSLVTGVAAIVGIIAAFTALLPVIARSGSTGSEVALDMAGWVVTLVVVGLVVMIVGEFIKIKAGGMSVLLAHETAFGRRPTFADLNQGTRGIIGRMIPLLLAGIAAALAAGALFTGLVFALVAGATVGSRGSGSSSGSSGGLLLLFIPVAYLAILVAILYFATRLIYFNQALAIERRTGFGALASSWRLTRRDFWRILGWYLAVEVLLALVSGTVSGPMSAMMFPLSYSGGGTSSDISTLIGYLLPTMLLWTVLVVALEVAIIPVTQIFTTVMYLDQLRRNQLPPGWQTTRAPEYRPGQPPYGYGQPQYPQPGYPQPGQQGYPQPGYPQPGQPPYGQPPTPPQA